MALPVTVTKVPVHIAIMSIAGLPAKGSVYFDAPGPIRNLVNDVVIGPGRITANLNTSGEATVYLPATNDPDNLPIDWTYAVTVNTNVWEATFNLEVPYDFSGTLELADNLGTSLAPSKGQAYLSLSGGKITGDIEVTGNLNVSSIPTTANISGAVSRNIKDVLQERVSIFDVMTPAQRADVLSGNPTLDHTAAFNTIIASCATAGIREYHIPAGTYRVVGTIVGGANVYGVGPTTGAPNFASQYGALIKHVPASGSVDFYTQSGGTGAYVTAGGFRNVSIQASPSGFSRRGLYYDNFVGADLDHLQIWGPWSDAAICLRGYLNSRFSKVRITNTDTTFNMGAAVRLLSYNGDLLGTSLTLDEFYVSGTLTPSAGGITSVIKADPASGRGIRVVHPVIESINGIAYNIGKGNLIAFQSPYAENTPNANVNTPMFEVGVTGAAAPNNAYDTGTTLGIYGNGEELTQYTQGSVTVTRLINSDVVLSLDLINVKVARAITLITGTNNTAKTRLQNVECSWATTIYSGLTPAKVYDLGGNVFISAPPLITPNTKVNKGELVINLKDYGAVGDGIADDTAAFASAMAAAVLAGSREVFIPAGTYKYTSLALTCSLRGIGMTKTILTGPQIVASTSNSNIEDLKIISSSTTAIISGNCERVRLVNIEVAHAGTVTTDHLAWNAFNVDRLQVVNCRFNIGGLQLSGCDDFYISGNFWDAQYLNVNEPCHISGQSSGIFTGNTVTNSATDCVDLYSSGHRCVISNNRFIGLRGAASLECKVTLSDDVNNTSSPGNMFDATIISNNVFKDFNSNVTSTRVGIFAQYVDNRTVRSFDITNTNRAILIEGNILEDFNATNPGNGAVVTWQGIAYTGHNGAIRGNIIKNMRGWNAAANEAINLSLTSFGVTEGIKSAGVSIQDNIITGVENGYGIRAGNLDHCNISGNTIRGDEDSNITTLFGIDVVANATVSHTTINNNLFHCNSATSQGLRAASGVIFNHCLITNNTFRDCSVAIGEIQDCTFSGNTVNNVTNNQAFSIAAGATISKGNAFIGNHITMSTAYGLSLLNMDGFTVQGNVFRGCARGLLFTSVVRNGVVSGNVSINQIFGTEFPMYSGVSAADQATILVGTNKATSGTNVNNTDQPFINVKDWPGIKYDGVTDDSAAFQTLLNSIPVAAGNEIGGACLFFPKGVLRLDTPVNGALATLSGKANVKFLGSGMGSRIRTQSATATELLKVIDSTLFTMEDILLHVIGTANIDHAVHLTTSSPGSAHEVRFNNVKASCNGNYRAAYDIFCTAGSATIYSAQAVFSAADVGGNIMLNLPSGPFFANINSINAVSSTLSAPIADTVATTISLTTALAGMPASGFTIQVGTERMFVSAGGNTTTLTVVRGRGPDLVKATAVTGAQVITYSAVLATTVPDTTTNANIPARIQPSANAVMQNGITIGAYPTGVGNLDIAGTVLNNCSVNRAAVAGVRVGNGTSANILDQYAYGLSVSESGTGVYTNGGSLSIFGGQFSHNTIDYRRGVGTSSPIVIEGIRSESCSSFYEMQGNATSGAMVSIKNVEVSVINAEDGVAIRHLNSGSLMLENLALKGSDIAASAIHIIGSGNSSSPCHLSAINVSTTGGNLDPFASSAFPATIKSILNTSRMANSTRATLVNTVLNNYMGGRLQLGGGLVKARTTVADANYTVLTSDTIVSYTSLTAARTVTLPAQGTTLPAGQEFIVKDETGLCDASKTITITPTAGTIDGLASIRLSSPYAEVKVYTNGTNWFSDRKVPKGELAANVRDFKVTGDPDDTLSITRAVATGARRIYFPAGNYTVAIPQGGSLGSWTGVDGIFIDAGQATITNTVMYAFQAGFTSAFLFNNCKNVRVEVGNYIGQVLASPTTDLGYRGEIFVRLVTNCDGAVIKGTVSNVRYAVQSGDYTDPTLGNCKNMDIKLRTFFCGYPIALYLSEGIRFDIDADDSHRAAYLAGCIDAKGIARWKNQYIADTMLIITDVKTGTGTSRGCKNMDVESIDKGSTIFQPSSMCAGISLSRVDPNTTFEDIKVNVYTKSTDTISSQIGGFRIVSAVTPVDASYAHNWIPSIVLRNIQVSGVLDHSAQTIDGCTSGDISIRAYDYLIPGPTAYGTLDGLSLQDLYIRQSSGNTRFSYLVAPGLSGSGASLRRIYAPEMTIVHETNPTASTYIEDVSLRQLYQTTSIAGGTGAKARLVNSAVDTYVNSVGDTHFVDTVNTSLAGAGSFIRQKYIVWNLSGGTTAIPNVLPANAMVLTVQGILTQTIAGATGYQVGVTGALTRYADVNTTAVNTTFTPASGTETAPRLYLADTTLQITAKGGTFTGGQIRVVVHYMTFSPLLP